MNHSSETSNLTMDRPKADRPKIDWMNASFLFLVPIVALGTMAAYIYYNGVHVSEVIGFIVCYSIAGMGVTMGYHRLFSHRAYDAHPIVKAILLIGGAMAFENSALKWSSDHRLHHKYCDHETDPYNAKKGFWWSHMGWILFKEPAGRPKNQVKDLAQDPLVQFQHRHYVAIALGFSWLLPLLVGFCFGRPFGFFLWAGLLRTVFIHHTTFFINSLAHICGKQTYDDQTTARDSWWLALFTLGEGFHNFHHRFASDYRNGVRWYHWDPSKWGIRTLSFLGLTSNLRKTPKETILWRKSEMDLKRLKIRLSEHCTVGRFQEISEDLEHARIKFRQALEDWKEALAAYYHAKKSLPSKAKDLRHNLKNSLKDQKEAFAQALEAWRHTLNYYAQAAALMPV